MAGVLLFDMVNWTEQPVPLRPTDFKWAKGDAWAAGVIKKDGEFYWYVTVTYDSIRPGKAIDVAVADSPTCLFKDARGWPLLPKI